MAVNLLGFLQLGDTEELIVLGSFDGRSLTLIYEEDGRSDDRTEVMLNRDEAARLSAMLDRFLGGAR